MNYLNNFFVSVHNITKIEADEAHELSTNTWVRHITFTIMNGDIEEQMEMTLFSTHPDSLLIKSGYKHA